MALASFNPLLHDVASVRDGGRVSLTFSPAAAAAAAAGRDGTGGDGPPAGGGTLRIDPVRVSVAEGPLLAQLTQLLHLGGLFGGGGGGGLGALFGGGGRRQLEVWTGPMEVSLAPGGACRLHRVDVLLGGKARVCLWGAANPLTDALEMRVGSPRLRSRSRACADCRLGTYCRWTCGAPCATRCWTCRAPRARWRCCRRCR